MQLLVKIPSRGRPTELIKRLEEFHLASKREDTRFIVVCDENDDSCNNEDFKAKVMSFPKTKLFFDPPGTKIIAHNAHVSDEEWDILIAASDDMIPLDGYDVIAIDEMSKYFPNTDGAIWFNTTDNAMTCTLTVIGRGLYDLMGYVYHPIYNSYYCDDEFSRVTAAMSKLKRVNKTIIKHIVYHDSHPADSTYLKSMVHALRDMTLYKTRRTMYFGMPHITTIDKNFPAEFYNKRNDGTHWLTSRPKLEDRMDPLEVYILEEGWREVLQMNSEQFASFARAFFRNERMTTPRIIHQIWMGDNIPADIQIMINTFKHDYIKGNPGWKHILWTEKELRDLPMINKELFLSEEKMDCRSDIARLEILRQFGGWYIDADCVWLGSKSLENIGQSSNGITLAFEKKGISVGKGYLNESTTRVANTVIGSTIENPFIAYLIGELSDSYVENRKNGVVASTGPDFIQSIIDDLASKRFKINIFQSDAFYPVWWCNDASKNPNHKEYLECLELNQQELSKRYPNAIIFHKGYTAKIEGCSV